MSIHSYLARFTAYARPTPSETLSLSQLAPAILNSSTIESPEQWALYENLLVSTLTTGDDKSARLVLERLSNRFGMENNRIMALHGLYEESVALDDRDLEDVLKGYEAILKDDPANLPIAKRRVTLLNHLNRPQEAITALTFLVGIVPTDAECWAQLAELYFQQNLYNQAIFSLEEVLLIIPNAYNIHARLGELQYISAEGSGSELQKLEASVKWFCRSIELCDGYLRGLYGLKLVTSRLLTSKFLTQMNPPPSTKQDVLQKLNTQCTTRLSEIVAGFEAQKKAFRGYDVGEVQAAAELLKTSDVVVG